MESLSKDLEILISVKIGILPLIQLQWIIRKMSSQNNVHPGVKEYVDENGDDIYSDARSF